MLLENGSSGRIQSSMLMPAEGRANYSGLISLQDLVDAKCVLEIEACDQVRGTVDCTPSKYLIQG